MPEFPPEFYEDDDPEGLLGDDVFLFAGRWASQPVEIAGLNLSEPAETVDLNLGEPAETVGLNQSGPAEMEVLDLSQSPDQLQLVHLEGQADQNSDPSIEHRYLSLNEEATGSNRALSHVVLPDSSPVNDSSFGHFGPRIAIRNARRRRRVRLARTIVVLFTLLVAVVAQLSGGGKSSQISSAGTSQRLPTKTSGSGSFLALSRQHYGLGGPFPVGEQTTTLQDSSRFIVSQSGAKIPRPLVATILYPAYKQAGLPTQQFQSVVVQSGAKAYLKAGPYPVVIFAPGFRQAPSTYELLLSYWAQAGYIVVGVTFPLTNPNAPGGPNENDIVNQPQDINFIVSQLTNQGDYAKDDMSFLNGMVDQTAIMLAGHSDGGDTVLAAAYNSCCNRYTYRAVVDMSGTLLNLPGGHYFSSTGAPLLILQGSTDTINPPGLSQSVFADDKTGPKYLVTLIGGGYIDEYSQETALEQIVATESLDFFGAYSKADARALNSLLTVGSQPGRSTIVTGNLNQTTSSTTTSTIPAVVSPTTSTSGALSSTSTTSTSLPTISTNPGAGTTIVSTSTTIFIPSG